MITAMAMLMDCAGLLWWSAVAGALIYAVFNHNMASFLVSVLIGLSFWAMVFVWVLYGVLYGVFYGRI